MKTLAGPTQIEIVMKTMVRRQDLNLRPQAYETCELTICSTPHREKKTNKRNERERLCKDKHYRGTPILFSTSSAKTPC